MTYLLLTFAVGLFCGLILYKLKVPGGMMVGTIIGVGALNIIFDAAYMPYMAKLAAQITAGAYIGCTVEKSDIQRMKYIYRPALVLLTAYLILDLVVGITIHYIGPFDLITSLLSAVPGGISDIPLIAADMGADTSKVVAMQFVRMFTGIGVFPGLIAAVDRYGRKRGNAMEPLEELSQGDKKSEEAVPQRAVYGKQESGSFIKTIIVACLAGVAGKLIGVPSGALLFSLLGVLVFKLLTDSAYMPAWAKRLAQVLSGSYIGCTVEYKDILEMRYLALPIFILLAGYLANCLITGRILNKWFGMSLKEGMLAATPAGASDMALISTDLGVQSPNLIVLHVIRLTTVVAVFPQIIYLLVMVIE